MKIASTDLVLQSDHAAYQRSHSEESLRAWRGQRPDFERQGNGNAGLPSAIADISAAARQALAANPAAAVPQVLGMPVGAVPQGMSVPANAAPRAPTSGQCGEAQAIQSACDAAENDPFIVLIKRMLELLTGEEVRLVDLEDFATNVSQAAVQASDAGASLEAAASGRVGWGVEYDYHAVQEEFESTSFSASGTIRTADGQEISFNLDVEMTRYYREETNVSLRAGDAVRKDPLVVNFDGTAAQLAGQANQRFSFDLDGDGRAEQLARFASGSGYLALDLNGNGRIDSGRELFGPATGNGFNELAKLDDDGNGWIDENDASFDKLSVWTPDGEGGDKLKSLATAGIGALGLGHVDTPFALRGADNSDLGQVKASGVYLMETGKAGSLQEIDLTI